MRTLCLLSLLLLFGCKKPPPPDPGWSDGPAGVPPGERPVTPPPQALPSPTASGGSVGSALDGERAALLEGAWRDQLGNIMRIDTPDSATWQGTSVPVMMRWCQNGDRTAVCLQVKVAPSIEAESPWLVLVADSAGALVQANVGERYVVSGPVVGGHRFNRLGPAPAPSALAADVRVQLGPDGAPLYCASAGVVSTTCDGHHHMVPLIPLHSRVVEERTLVLVGRGAPQGCNPGLRIDETLSAVSRIDLGRIVTPVEPRDDHLRTISTITGIPDPKVQQAVWIDLDKDRREELVFELWAEAEPTGRPGYSVVGYLAGGTLEPYLLEVHHGQGPDQPPPRAHIQGLVDVAAKGQLSLLVGLGQTSWVIWGLEDGAPVERARHTCS
ncbi:MAG: hypothetical protein H6739_10700 [Alphaproteobacteria bacterium]|nr:hypothetical protein [Alphaproteobacteria bacterium]